VRAAAFAPRLVIMVKEPVAGRVKTRLARGIGTIGAVGAYRAMLQSIAARLAGDARWEALFAVSPDVSVASHMLPVPSARFKQGGGDLGQKLQHIFDILPPGPVVVIGTDIPGITVRDIADAFGALGSYDAVFGPSPDGGYWLVGMKRRPHVPRAFENVRWSSEHALADTLGNLADFRVARLRTCDDIDDAADLIRLAPLVGRRIPPRS
jgi:uncharacterized protein